MTPAVKCHLAFAPKLDTDNFWFPQIQNSLKHKIKLLTCYNLWQLDRSISTIICNGFRDFYNSQFHFNGCTFSHCLRYLSLNIYMNLWQLLIPLSTQVLFKNILPPLIVGQLPLSPLYTFCMVVGWLLYLPCRSGWFLCIIVDLLILSSPCFWSFCILVYILYVHVFISYS